MKTNEQHLQSVLTAKGFDITVEQVRIILDEVVELAATTGTSLQDAYEGGEMFWEEEYAGHEVTDTEVLVRINDIAKLLFPGCEGASVTEVRYDEEGRFSELHVVSPDGALLGILDWDRIKERVVGVQHQD